MTIQAIEFIEAAAAALAALRLLYLGLYRTQTALLAYTASSAVILAAMAGFPTSSSEYFRLFVTGTIASCALGVFAVREMFALALVDYPGLRSMVRWAVLVSFVCSAAVSMLVAGAAWRGGPAGHNAMLFYVESINRSVVLTLVVFIAIFLALISRYPLHLPWNTIVSCGFFGAIFLSESLSTLADTLSPHLYSSTVDAAHVGFSSLCFAAWAVLLRRQAETPRKILFHRPDEARLLHELESLNTMLSRAGRK